MLSYWLPAPLIGVLTVSVMFVALIFWFCVMLPGVLLRLIPWAPLQRLAGRYCVAVARRWVGTNQLIFRALHPMDWEIEFNGSPDPRRSYLLIGNHQSWADILILFDVFHGRVPFLRFFLKHELRYVPIIGLVCWAMDFPFMKRHTRETLAANPQLRNEDLETTRRTCEIYKTQPVTVVNFLEGTRFSEAKRQAKGSPFRHLLRPKSAGVAFTVAAMGEQFAGVLDVTLAYRPPRDKSLLWSWLCGEQNQISLIVDLLPIPADLLNGDYEQDPAYRARVQRWVNDIWERKDHRLKRLRDPQQHPDAHAAAPY
jgi:1-acyl-sn-glycerol-3-phosphate acyltransferase